jgi:hypothetical protein
MRDINADLKKLSTDGFVELQDYFSLDLIDSLNEDIAVGMNQKMCGVHFGYIDAFGQKTLAHPLSYGHNVIDVFTDSYIYNLALRYAQEPIHMTQFRIYEAPADDRFKMYWHVDNNITKDTGIESDKKVLTFDDLGVVFIVYLTDVGDCGGTQIVRGSHLWARKNNFANYNDKEDEFRDDIVSHNNRKRGTCLVYDYACVHRGEPLPTGNNHRTSLFGRLAPTRTQAGEPVLLNTRDLNNMNDEQKQILRFGIAPTCRGWPELWDSLRCDRVDLAGDRVDANYKPIR